MSYDARSEFDVQKIVNEYGLGEDDESRRWDGQRKLDRPHRYGHGRRAQGLEELIPLSDILFEHSFIRALERKGFPYYLPKPLRTRAGRSVVAMNGTYVWLYKYIEGSSSRPPRNTVILQMARALAAAHKAARRFFFTTHEGDSIALEHPWLLHSLRRVQLKVADNQGEHHRFFAAHVQECIGILQILVHAILHAAPSSHSWRYVRGKT